PILVGALIIAVIALVVTVVLQFTGSSDSQTIQAMPSRYQVYESGQANELLANRDDDPRPFTERDFFREGDTDISSRELTFTLHAQDITETGTEAVRAPRAVAAVEGADGAQVARAGYLSDAYLGVAAGAILSDIESWRARGDAT